MTSDVDLLALWAFDTSARVSPGIIREYRRTLASLAQRGPLLAATPLDLRKFMLSEAERGLKPGTLSIVRRALRSFYGWAFSEQLIDGNPAATIPPVREREVIVRNPDQAVRGKLVAACCSVRDVAFMELLWGSGARRGEVLALTLSDVNLEAGTILIRRTKTARARTAYLDARARRALTTYLKQRHRLAPETDALWVRRNGEPLNDGGARMLVRRVAHRAGVPFSAHDARRAYATEWLRRGGSETGLMATCGWSGVGMVRRYTAAHATELAIAEGHRLFG